MSLAPADVLEAHRRWRSGDGAGARALCDAVLAEAPGHPGALYILGMMAFEARDGASALRYLREAAARNDAPPFVFDGLSEVCVALGRLDEAAASLERALSIAADTPRLWQRLATIEFRRGQYEHACRALERVIALEPDSPQPRNHLGIIHQQCGRPDRAAECYRAALRLNPDYAETHSNLAAALAMLGEYDGALSHACTAIALRPDYPGPYVHAAFAEADRGHCDAALAWIERIPASASGNAAIALAHAEILRKFDRFEECIEACNKAIALDPQSDGAYHCLGMAFDALGRDSEALAAFDRAIAIAPRSAVAIANKANVLMQIGRREEATMTMERARALEPNSASILYMWAVLREFDLSDGELDSIERLLPNTTTPSHTDRMHLHFVLGNAWLQRHASERAFHHLGIGNRIKRSLIRYDPDADARRFSETIAAFPASKFASSIGLDSDLPIFVIGMPRSGTSLVEQILASHPRIHGAGELRHMALAVKRAEAQYHQAFPFFAADIEDFRDIGRDYLDRLGPAPQGITRIVDKMPLNSLFAGLIHGAFPRARIIHCRRDPVDTCLSCYSKLFLSGQEFTFDLAELGRYYRAHETLMAHWRGVLPPQSFLEIDYENIVDAFDLESRRLIAFCGLEWSESCRDFHATRRPVRTSSSQQVRKPLYRSSIGRAQEFRKELASLMSALRGSEARTEC